MLDPTNVPDYRGENGCAKSLKLDLAVEVYDYVNLVCY
jgi:hypothetical protein